VIKNLYRPAHVRCVQAANKLTLECPDHGIHCIDSVILWLGTFSSVVILLHVCFKWTPHPIICNLELQLMAFLCYFGEVFIRCRKKCGFCHIFDWVCKYKSDPYLYNMKI
jgi:hypothetical protein